MIARGHVNTRPLTLAVFKFASCDGCQLSLLAAEDELLGLAERLEIVYFLEATSRQAPGPYDVALVEGSITTPDDAARIRQVRRDARFLVTIGACATAGGWLGLGQQNVRKVDILPDNSIDLGALETAIRAAHSAGERIAAIVATMGTTDAFGVDDLAGVHALRERLVQELQLDYRPHIHADAVIGWAWAVFNDYDFAGNPLGFRGRTLRALAATQHSLQHLRLADSVGVDFHKTGFAPYISSLFLLREREDFSQIVRQRSTTPYLFHTGEYHPGLFSLETSRSATGVLAALANLLLLGREGFQTLIGHAVEMAEILREQIGARPELSVMNDLNHGPVTLFRAYPAGTDTFAVKQREQHDASFREQLRRNNDLNRRIFERVHAEAMAGRGVALGFTDRCRTADCGEPISALKSYVLSPFADEGRMKSVVTHVLEARSKVIESA